MKKSLFLFSTIVSSMAFAPGACLAQIDASDEPPPEVEDQDPCDVAYSKIDRESKESDLVQLWDKLRLDSNSGENTEDALRGQIKVAYDYLLTQYNRFGHKCKDHFEAAEDDLAFFIDNTEKEIIRTSDLIALAQTNGEFLSLTPENDQLEMLNERLRRLIEFREWLIDLTTL